VFQNKENIDRTWLLELKLRELVIYFINLYTRRHWCSSINLIFSFKKKSDSKSILCFAWVPQEYCLNALFYFINTYTSLKLCFSFIFQPYDVSLWYNKLGLVYKTFGLLYLLSESSGILPECLSSSICHISFNIYFLISITIYFKKSNGFILSLAIVSFFLADHRSVFCSSSTQAKKKCIWHIFLLLFLPNITYKYYPVLQISFLQFSFS